MCGENSWEGLPGNFLLSHWKDTAFPKDNWRDASIWLPACGTPPRYTSTALREGGRFHSALLRRGKRALTTSITQYSERTLEKKRLCKLVKGGRSELHCTELTFWLCNASNIRTQTCLVQLQGKCISVVIGYPSSQSYEYRKYKSFTARSRFPLSHSLVQWLQFYL